MNYNPHGAGSDFTSETLALTKQALASALSHEEMLAKAWTQSPSATAGLTQYSLEAPAKTLYPVLTPLRNEVPRKSGAGMGIQSNWKAITAINTDAISAGIGEGNRGGVISTTVEDYNAPFRGIGLDDNATFEAQYSAEGFDDVKARMSQGLLRSMMIAEEKIILGGIGSFGLGQTPTPVVAAVGSGGTIPTTTTVLVTCVALTMAGFQIARAGGANPVRGQVTKLNADGSTDTHGGFSARASAEASVATAAANSSVTATVTPLRGACGYAWFVRVGGSQETARFFGVTSTNSVVITSVPTTTQQLGADLIANDRSRNHLQFDGLLGFAAQSALRSYYKAMPTGTLGVGTALTADNNGGIVELDEACAHFWDEHKLGPDYLWCSSQQLLDMSRKVLAGGNTTAARFMFASDQTDVQGGRVLTRYINPFFAKPIKVRVHPDIPHGTMLFTTHSLPYQASGVIDVMQMLCRRDYYQIDWPKRSRKDEIGVYADEVLQHYFPPSLGVITNIAKG